MVKAVCQFVIDLCCIEPILQIQPREGRYERPNRRPQTFHSASTKIARDIFD